MNHETIALNVMRDISDCFFSPDDMGQDIAKGIRWGSAEGEGDDKALIAARKVMEQLGDIRNARSALICVSTHKKSSRLTDFSRVTKTMREHMAGDALVTACSRFDPALKVQEMRVTVVAMGELPAMRRASVAT